MGCTVTGNKKKVSASLRVLSSSLIAPLMVVTLLWYVLIKAVSLPKYLAKSPIDAFEFLFQGSQAAANRAVMLAALGDTLRDALLGFAGGMIVGLVVAYAVCLHPAVRQGAMPFALAARAVPLVAMTPLIALVFGYTLLSITLVGTIVVFFPTFVNVVGAVDSLPVASEDLITVFGGSRLQYLRYVAAPGTVTAIFASARIAGPGAILGAVFAEWLISGRGLGYMMVTASENSAFTELWMAVWLVTAASLIAYRLFGDLERTMVRILGLKEDSSISHA